METEVQTAADPLRSWSDQLDAWAIPPAILAQATESPWYLPHDTFVRRADESVRAPRGISYERALEALAKPGVLLDIGCGAGAASLPLLDQATELIVVDQGEPLVSELRGRATQRGRTVQAIIGTWPDVADRSPVADVVVCHNVFYNVADLGPFVRALDSHARRRVVVELGANHPIAWTNPLWKRFHGLDRPQGPTSDDAVLAVQSMGIDVRVERESSEGQTPSRTFDDLVAMARRRLCLAPDRDADVAAAIRDLGYEPDRPETWGRAGGAGRAKVTLWWNGSATV